MLEQCWALFLVKWTMIKRGMGKEHFSSYLILGGLFLGGAFISFVATMGLYALGRRAGASESPMTTLLLLDSVVLIYCFFYAWGILLEIQRADIFDFKKLLLLPVSMPAIYMMNFLVSLFGPLLLFSFPAFLGLLCGLYLYWGVAVFLAGIPMAMLLVLALGAWSYYLRGRLAILMENPKRRRFIFMLLPVGFIVLAQLPAVIVHLAAKNGSGQEPAQLLEALRTHILLGNRVVPFLWPAYGLWTGISGPDMLPFFLCAAGLLLVTLIGLWFGYVTTLRHYTGAYNYSNRAAGKRSRNDASMPVTGKRLPCTDEDTASLVFAFYKSFARHPHVRMLIIMPLCFGVFILFMHRSGAYGTSWNDNQEWIPMAALLWPFINFSFFMFNIFGIDALSFQALQLSPLPRYKYLFAKNVAIAPIVFGLASFFVSVAALLTGASAEGILLSLLLAVHLLFLFCSVGNFLSIKFPRRLHRDALRIPARRLHMLIASLLTMMLSIVMVMPALLCMLLARYPVGLFHTRYTALLLAAILAAGSFFIYRIALMRAGDLLIAEEQRIYIRLTGDRD